MILAFTAYTDDGTKQTYSTAIYQLTQGDNKFIVTLTPTAADFSGTMDKTPQEITAAYNAGMKIVFDIPSLYAQIDADQYLQTDSNIKAAAKVFYDIDDAPVLITIATHGDDDNQTYATGIYPLTPISQ